MLIKNMMDDLGEAAIATEVPIPNVRTISVLIIRHMQFT